MYSKVRAAAIEKNDINYLPAGIHEDVVLENAKYEESPNGNKFIEFTFSKNGQILKHTEWEPTKGMYVTTDEDLQKKVDNQFSRILQILVCFYKDEELEFEGESFKEFAQWVAEKLMSADKSKKLRVKVIYNKKGYTTLPGYSKYTFIEPMELPEGKASAITELSIDTFVKPIVADKEMTVNNPFANSSVNTTSSPEVAKAAFAEAQKTDDLPF